jgi:hypothetical protein
MQVNEPPNASDKHASGLPVFLVSIILQYIEFDALSVRDDDQRLA